MLSENISLFVAQREQKTLPFDAQPLTLNGRIDFPLDVRLSLRTTRTLSSCQPSRIILEQIIIFQQLRESLWCAETV